MLALIELENELWTPEVGESINPATAENYHIIQSPGSLSLVMASNIPFSGWLAKNVQPLPVQSTSIALTYKVMIDDATLQCGQVIETDMKLTDEAGYTYNGSGQFVVVEGWKFQIGNWQDSGIAIPPMTPYIWHGVMIEYLLDYVKKTLSVIALTVDGVRQVLPANSFHATQVGWTPSQIVTQLQQCNRDVPGGYTLRFTQIGYRL